MSLFLFYVKIGVYALLRGMEIHLFGGGNDSDYYHAYAIGEVDNAVNIWPVILRFMNEWGFYSRDFVSYFMLFLNVVIIPALVIMVSAVRGAVGSQRVSLVAYAVIGAYPTLFMFSLDMYRDLVMVVLFLLALLSIKKITAVNLPLFSVISFVVLCYVSFLFRPYLGAALFLSLLLLVVYYKTSNYFKMWVFLYAVGLMLAQALGVFESITTYRGEEGFSGGGATLGVGLHGRDPFSFLMLYCYSFLAQILGLYFPNLPSVLVFLVESVPFFAVFYYVIRNRQFMDVFCKYLVVFFIVYSTIWVIGNDNLGTAVRLRMPSYISIFICFLIVSQRKRLSTSGVGCNAWPTRKRLVACHAE